MKTVNLCLFLLLGSLIITLIGIIVIQIRRTDPAEEDTIEPSNSTDADKLIANSNVLLTNDISSPKKPFKCPYTFNTAYYPGDSCYSYWICTQGNGVQYQCPYGMGWNPTIKRCAQLKTGDCLDGFDDGTAASAPATSGSANLFQNNPGMSNWYGSNNQPGGLQNQKPNQPNSNPWNYGFNSMNRNSGQSSGGEPKLQSNPSASGSLMQPGQMNSFGGTFGSNNFQNLNSGAGLNQMNLFNSMTNSQNSVGSNLMNSGMNAMNPQFNSMAMIPGISGNQDIKASNPLGSSRSGMNPMNSLNNLNPMNTFAFQSPGNSMNFFESAMNSGINSGINSLKSFNPGGQNSMTSKNAGIGFGGMDFFSMLKALNHTNVNSTVKNLTDQSEVKSNNTVPVHNNYLNLTEKDWNEVNVTNLVGLTGMNLTDIYDFYRNLTMESQKNNSQSLPDVSLNSAMDIFKIVSSFNPELVGPILPGNVSGLEDSSRGNNSSQNRTTMNSTNELPRRQPFDLEVNRTETTKSSSHFVEPELQSQTIEKYTDEFNVKPPISQQKHNALSVQEVPEAHSLPSNSLSSNFTERKPIRISLGSLGSSPVNVESDKSEKTIEPNSSKASETIENLTENPEEKILEEHIAQTQRRNLTVPTEIRPIKTSTEVHQTTHDHNLASNVPILVQKTNSSTIENVISEPITNESVLTTTSELNTTASVRCPFTFTYHYIPSPDCHNYTSCIFGVGTKRTCPDGKEWNQKRHFCDNPLTANCSIRAGSSQNMTVLSVQEEKTVELPEQVSQNSSNYSPTNGFNPFEIEENLDQSESEERTVPEKKDPSVKIHKNDGLDISIYENTQVAGEKPSVLNEPQVKKKAGSKDNGSDLKDNKNSHKSTDESSREVLQVAPLIPSRTRVVPVPLKELKVDLNKPLPENLCPRDVSLKHFSTNLCYAYVKCEDGDAMIETCPETFEWDQEKGECKISSTGC